MLLAVGVNTARVRCLLHVVLRTPARHVAHQLLRLVPLSLLSSCLGVVESEHIRRQHCDLLVFGVSIGLSVDSNLRGQKLSVFLFANWSIGRVSMQLTGLSLICCRIIELWLPSGLSSANGGGQVSFLLVCIGVHGVSEQALSALVVFIQTDSLAWFDLRTGKNATLPILLVSCHSLV